MKKNTLFVSIVAGFGSLAAVFAVLNNGSEAQYSPREMNASATATKVNSEFFSEMRSNVKTGKVETSDYINAVQAAKLATSSRATTLNWEFSGPDNIGGRARHVLIDNVNPDIIYAGGAGGGMYVSNNASGTWNYKSTDWDNIQVSTLAQDGNGRVYAGTGFYADAGPATGGTFPGGGVWVSDDRGDTWSHLASTLPNAGGNDEWSYVNRIAVSQVKNSNGNYSVYAGTSKGLKVSLDNGVTWTEPMKVPNNCSVDLNGQIQEVVVTSTNRVLVSRNGALYISEEGEVDCSYTEITNQDGIGSSTRMSLSVCQSDENKVYAFQSFGGSPATFQILSSADGGLTWGPLSPAPPTSVIDSTFDLMGSNPASFNQAITVDPNDCDRIYVGAVELYRVDGSWSSVALNFASAPFYVHSDKHWFQYSPHDPNTMYVASDGGIGKTVNANSSTVQWTENNRHFGTTQYYGVAFTKDGRIIGGTQDNGSHLIDPRKTGNARKDAVEILGGDGFDCETSNISEVAFATLYYGQINRILYGGDGAGSSMIHPQNEGGSPFNTVIRFWESENDLTSQDSVKFVNSVVSDRIQTGDGIKKYFEGTLVKPQEIADIVPGSFVITDVAGGQEAKDDNANGILFSFGDSVGTIDYASGDYNVRFAFAPPTASTINGTFDVIYNAGDTLDLVSQNMGIEFDYVLPSNVAEGDSFLVQDPVQTLMAVSMFGGIRVTREALYFPLGTPRWLDINVGSGSPRAMEWSNDGNHLYVGTGRSVVRISGFNDLYMTDDPAAKLTNTTVFSGGASVSGINLHPTDPEKMVVTLAQYGSFSHIYEMTNVQSATTIAARRDISSADLLTFPIYDPEYNVHNTDQVLIGTELGLWASDDISGSNPVWTNQSGTMGNVPVLDVRQQRLTWSEAANFGRFYIGTFGRGIWTTSDLVSVDDEPWDDFVTDRNISNMKMYPNPVSTTANLSFELPVAGAARVVIYDITGKVVLNEMKNFASGTVEYQVNANNLPGGTYFASVSMGDVRSQTKFVVIK